MADSAPSVSAPQPKAPTTQASPRKEEQAPNALGGGLADPLLGGGLPPDPLRPKGPAGGAPPPPAGPPGGPVQLKGDPTAPVVPGSKPADASPKRRALPPSSKSSSPQTPAPKPQDLSPARKVGARRFVHKDQTPTTEPRPELNRSGPKPGSGPPTDDTATIRAELEALRTEGETLGADAQTHAPKASASLEGVQAIRGGLDAQVGAYAAKPTELPAPLKTAADNVATQETVAAAGVQTATQGGADAASRLRSLTQLVERGKEPDKEAKALALLRLNARQARGEVQTERDRAAGGAESSAGALGKAQGELDSFAQSSGLGELQKLDAKAGAGADLIEQSPEALAEGLKAAVGRGDFAATMRTLQGRATAVRNDMIVGALKVNSPKAKNDLAECRKRLEESFSSTKRVLIQRLLSSGQDFLRLVDALDIAIQDDAQTAVEMFEASTPGQKDALRQFIRDQRALLPKQAKAPLFKLMEKHRLTGRFDASEGSAVDDKATDADKQKRAEELAALLTAQLKQRGKDDIPNAMEDIQKITAKAGEEGVADRLNAILNDPASALAVAVKALKKGWGWGRSGFKEKQVQQIRNLSEGGGQEDPLKAAQSGDLTRFEAAMAGRKPDDMKPRFVEIEAALKNRFSGKELARAVGVLRGGASTGGYAGLKANALTDSGGMRRFFNKISAGDAIKALGTMSEEELLIFRGDVGLQRALRGGTTVTKADWDQICKLAGLHNDAGKDPTGANPGIKVTTVASGDALFPFALRMARHAERMRMSLDHFMYIADADFGAATKAMLEIDRARKEALATLIEKGTPEPQAKTRVKELLIAQVGPSVEPFRGQKSMRTLVTQLLDWVQGGGETVSAAQVAERVAGSNLEIAMAMFEAMPAAELLNSWSNKAEYMRLVALMKSYSAGGPESQKLVPEVQRRVDGFVLDVNPQKVAGFVKSKGLKALEFRNALRDAIVEAAGNDPDLPSSEAEARLMAEKIRYAKVQEEVSLKRQGNIDGKKSFGGRISKGMMDTFSNKGALVDVSQGTHGARLREGTRELASTDANQREEKAAEVSDLAEKQREQTSARLQAYEEMKTKVATIAVAVLGALLTIAAAVASGGIGGALAPLVAGLIVAGVSPALNHLLELAIRGGSMVSNWSKVLKDTLIDLLATAATSVIGGAINQAFKECKNLLDFGKLVEAKVTGMLGGQGSGFAAFMGKAVADQLTKLPQKTVVLLATMPVEAAAAFGKDGMDGLAEFQAGILDKFKGMPVGIFGDTLTESLYAALGGSPGSPEKGAKEYTLSEGQQRSDNWRKAGAKMISATIIEASSGAVMTAVKVGQGQTWKEAFCERFGDLKSWISFLGAQSAEALGTLTANQLDVKGEKTFKGGDDGELGNLDDKDAEDKGNPAENVGAAIWAHIHTSDDSVTWDKVAESFKDYGSLG